MTPGGINVSDNIQWKQSIAVPLLRLGTIIILICTILAAIIIYQNDQDILLGIWLISLGLIANIVSFKENKFNLVLSKEFDEVCQILYLHLKSTYNEVKEQNIYNLMKSKIVAKSYYIKDIQLTVSVFLNEDQRVVIQIANVVLVKDKKLIEKLKNDILDLFED